MRMAHGSQEERGEKINGFGHCTNIACFGLTLYYIFNLDPLPDLNLCSCVLISNELLSKISIRRMLTSAM